MVDAIKTPQFDLTSLRSLQFRKQFTIFNSCLMSLVLERVEVWERAAGVRDEAGVAGTGQQAGRPDRLAGGPALWLC